MQIDSVLLSTEVMVGFIYTEVISLVTCVRPCRLINSLCHVYKKRIVISS